MRTARKRRPRQVHHRPPVPSLQLPTFAKPGTILKPYTPRVSPRNRRKPIARLETEHSPRPPPPPQPPSEPPPISARRRPRPQPPPFDPTPIKCEIAAGHFIKRECGICHANFGFKDLAILSCGHVCHLQCLLDFRRNANPRNQCCPFCRRLYQFTEVQARDVLQSRAAVLIQRHVRGFLFRRNIGDIAVPGTIMHRKWVLGRAQNASTLLVSAIETQSDAVDAILASIDKELDWARTVMKAVSVQEMAVDWADVKSRVIQRGCGTCSVCLRDIPSDECAVTSCGHCFHQQCLAEWLQFCSREDATVLCPFCRSAFQYRPLYSYKQNFAEIGLK